jgi:hypothetical protein
MRQAAWIGVPLVALCLGLGACDGGDAIDTSKLEKSFSIPQPASQQALDEVKAAVAAKDYAKAGAALQKLAGTVSLTPEQKQAVQDVANQVKDKVAQKAKEAVKEGEKAMGDVQKRLSD